MPDPNKIEGGRWDRVLRSKFNLKGYGSTSARISDDVSPTFNFPYRLEDDYLISDRLMVGEAQGGPVAAMRPSLILTNTSDDLLLIVEKIIFNNSGGASPYFGATSSPVPFVAAAPIHVRDGRWAPFEADVGTGGSRLQGFTAATATTPRVVRFVDGVQTTFFPNWVLPPNTHCFMSNTTPNTFLIATFFWREHHMEPSEVA